MIRFCDREVGCVEYASLNRKELLTTTCHGEEQAWNNDDRMIKNFDLEPVYNTYKEFFLNMIDFGLKNCWRMNQAEES